MVRFGQWAGSPEAALDEGRARAGMNGHVMCLMFVAFKHIDPTLDSEMDFEEPYLAALSMYRSSK